jgi:hypothetical protein
MMSEAVPIMIAVTLTQEMMLMAFVDFLALKYLQAKLRYMQQVKAFSLR